MRSWSKQGTGQRQWLSSIITYATDFSFSDTDLLAPQVVGIYFYLYLFMDIFSRKVVGWPVYETKST